MEGSRCPTHREYGLTRPLSWGGRRQDRGGPEPGLVQPSAAQRLSQAETEPSVPQRPCGTMELAAVACGAALALV